jgi:hypothetical protein
LVEAWHVSDEHKSAPENSEGGTQAQTLVPLKENGWSCSVVVDSHDGRARSLGVPFVIEVRNDDVAVVERAIVRETFGTP